MNLVDKYLHVFLFALIIILKISVVLNSDDYFKREHSLVKPYQVSGITIPHWDFTGSVMVSNSYVRLTPDLQSKFGALWNKVPCSVRNWELQLHFKVHGKGKDLFGDGMAIWYAKMPLQPGPVFGSVDFFHGLAIFLDTYANHNGPHNHEHPYISAMINNGTLHYDHDRDGTHTELAGCHVKFRNAAYDTFLSVRYENDVLVVSSAIDEESAWTECFTVKDVKLPTGYFFGVTATTGDLSDNHDIMSLRLFELEVPEDMKTEDRSNIMPAATYFAPPRDHVEDPPSSSMSGTKLFLILVGVVLGVCVCIIGGAIAYQKNQENKLKRLY